MNVYLLTILATHLLLSASDRTRAQKQFLQHKVCCCESTCVRPCAVAFVTGHQLSTI